MLDVFCHRNNRYNTKSDCSLFLSSFLLGRIVLFMLHFKSIWIGLLGEGFYMIEVPRSIIPLYYMTVLIKSPGVLFQCLGPWEFRPDASLTSARPTTVTTAYRLTTSGLRKDGPGRWWTTPSGEQFKLIIIIGKISRYGLQIVGWFGFNLFYC